MNEILETATEAIVPVLVSWLPALFALVLVVAGLILVDRLSKRGFAATGSDRGVARQLLMLAATVVGVIAVVLCLPIEGSQKGQLLSLFGLLLSAAIALSSTTFLGNAIAGLMIRAVEDFRPGDFIQVGEHFGRVSERGLLHVEIQSEARDLITVPNLHVVSNPVKVVRASGTIVSAEVSLGYDVDQVRVQQLLLRAIESADLTDPFVRILNLGDFSVTYRASGFLKDVKQLLSASSRLHAAVLDVLHGDRVEIVSPNFMNQRVLEPGQLILADPTRRAVAPADDRARPEDIVFDKAESAALREQLRDRHQRLVDLHTRLQAQLQEEEEEEEEARQTLERRIASAERQIERLALALAEDPVDDD